MVSQISNCHFYFVFLWGVRKEGSVGGSLDRSVQWSVDQVRRVVHGPGVSVVGSPLSKLHVPPTHVAVFLTTSKPEMDYVVEPKCIK